MTPQNIQRTNNRTALSDTTKQFRIYFYIKTQNKFLQPNYEMKMKILWPGNILQNVFYIYYTNVQKLQSFAKGVTNAAASA